MCNVYFGCSSNSERVNLFIAINGHVNWRAAELDQFCTLNCRSTGWYLNESNDNKQSENRFNVFRETKIKVTWNSNLMESSCDNFPSLLGNFCSVCLCVYIWITHFMGKLAKQLNHAFNGNWRNRSNDQDDTILSRNNWRSSFFFFVRCWYLFYQFYLTLAWKEMLWGGWGGRMWKCTCPQCAVCKQMHWNWWESVGCQIV